MSPVVRAMKPLAPGTARGSSLCHLATMWPGTKRIAGQASTRSVMLAAMAVLPVPISATTMTCLYLRRVRAPAATTWRCMGSRPVFFMPGSRLPCMYLPVAAHSAGVGSP